MSRSFGWGASELPSSGDLDPFLPHHTAGHFYTLKCEEPPNLDLALVNTQGATAGHNEHPASSADDFTALPISAPVPLPQVLNRLKNLRAAPHLPQFDVREATVQFRTQLAHPKQPRRTPEDHLWHLDYEQLSTLIHHDHFIPLSHGFSQRKVDELLPGCTWQSAINLMHTTDVWMGPAAKPGATSIPVPTCRPTAKELHITRDDDWIVEWTDGWVTEAPTRLAGPR